MYKIIVLFIIFIFCSCSNVNPNANAQNSRVLDAERINIKLSDSSSFTVYRFIDYSNDRSKICYIMYGSISCS